MATIAEAPPYSLGMPLDVIYAYLALDSLSKNESSVQEIRQYAEDSLNVDDIKFINKYIYEAIDYNPFLFDNYLHVGYYLNDKYNKHPLDLFFEYKQLSENMLGRTSLENMLVFSSGIYEVVVVDVHIDSSFNDSPNDNYRLRDVVCITAVVEDVIKGGLWSAHACESQEGSCISFSFLRSAVTFIENPDEENGNPVGVFVLDSVGVDSTGAVIYEESLSDRSNIYAAIHSPAVGSRYLLFAHLWSYYYTTQNGPPYYIVPQRLYQREGGLFKIESGYLLDESNYFGQGTTIEIEEYKAWLRQYITDNILNP